MPFLKTPQQFSQRAEELSYASPYQDELGNPALTIWKVAGSRYLRLAYLDGTQFWLDREGPRSLDHLARQALTLEDTATYLLGRFSGYCCGYAA